MFKTIKYLALGLVLGSGLLACSSTTKSEFKQPRTSLLQGEVMAVAYSGYRAGQHPDQGKGAKNPSAAEILEDLQMLAKKEFKLIRLYGSGDKSELVLRLIREHRLPIKAMLGIWIDAEVSNHEGCPWLDEPIPETKLAANKIANQKELQRGIDLANAYKDVVIAVNVGNESLIDWTDHMVKVETLIDYVRQVKANINQPVTVAENYVWWIRNGKQLASELDFVGVHTYPIWENKSIEEGLNYMIENIEDVRMAVPGIPIAILETGWATTASEFKEAANEKNQLRYYNEVKEWAEKTNTTVFFFEAFDESWKGNPDNPNGAEKHWGIYFIDRKPKQVMRR